MDDQSKADDKRPREFRWQALFQRAHEPLFLLNQQRRLVFVNEAWEKLTGLKLSDVRGCVCKRRPIEPGAALADLVPGLLAPTHEVRQGQQGRARRLVPDVASAAGPQWWDITFLPFRQGDEIIGILGIISATAVSPTGAAPVPERIANLSERRNQSYCLDQISDALPTMPRVAQQVRLASQIDAPVLLVGEHGTGKQWTARVIHSLATNRTGHFAAVDCEQLPPTLVSEILFGAGGWLERWQVRTVYLREPAALPRDLQDNLARWLSQREDDAGLHLRAGPRILSGQCEAPEESVRHGRLLPQLSALLTPLVIQLPPLRERLADLPHLLERLLPTAREAADKQIAALSAETIDLLRQHRWPQNVRELYQVLVSACLRAKGERIEPGDLPLYLRSAAAPQTAPRALPLDALLEQVERRLIAMALRLSQDNKAKAAELLAVWRPRLLRRMEALGITDRE